MIDLQSIQPRWLRFVREDPTIISNYKNRRMRMKRVMKIFYGKPETMLICPHCGGKFFKKLEKGESGVEGGVVYECLHLRCRTWFWRYNPEVEKELARL